MGNAHIFLLEISDIVFTLATPETHPSGASNYMLYTGITPMGIC